MTARAPLRPWFLPWFLPRFRLAALLAPLLLMPTAVGGAEIAEDELKAAFVYNFVVFTDWPLPTADRPTPLRLCAPITSHLLPALRTLQDKRVQERSIAVVELEAGATALNACDVLLLDPDSEPPTLAPWPPQPGQLTIADDPRRSVTAIITMRREGQHIRFDVDAAVARQAGVRMSSRMLSLARQVR